MERSIAGRDENLSRGSLRVVEARVATAIEVLKSRRVPNAIVAARMAAARAADACDTPPSDVIMPAHLGEPTQRAAVVDPAFCRCSRATRDLGERGGVWRSQLAESHLAIGVAQNSSAKSLSVISCVLEELTHFRAAPNCPFWRHSANRHLGGRQSTGPSHGADRGVRTGI